MGKRPNPELIDDKNPEWTADDFKTAAPFNDLTTSLQAKLRGRPKGSDKTQITLRVDNDTLAAFRALGDGLANPHESSAKGLGQSALGIAAKVELA